jgi:hypothetical protein
MALGVADRYFSIHQLQNIMTSTIRLFLLVFVFINFQNQLGAQGCSDAGVCTAGIMSGETSKTTAGYKFYLEPGIHLASGDDGTQIITTMLEAAYAITPHSLLQIKIPYHAIDGNLGATSGIGDITVTFSYRQPTETVHQFAYFAGIRLATGKTNLQDDELWLPMVYQTGLGTTDLLLGARWDSRGWAATLGYQQPLAQNNENGFLQSRWEDNPDVIHYHDSRGIERSADIVARIEKTIPIGNFAFTGGLVPIYHVTQDSYLNENDVRTQIAGSDGLTLNIAIQAVYTAGERFRIKAFYGSPLITRDVQPAGLARSYVAGITVGFGL